MSVCLFLSTVYIEVRVGGWSCHFHIVIVVELPTDMLWEHFWTGAPMTPIYLKVKVLPPQKLGGRFDEALVMDAQVDCDPAHRMLNRKGWCLNQTLHPCTES